MTTELKIRAFDAAQYLDNEAAVAAYLTDAFESGDDAVFQEALQVAARARGMSEVARSSGLGRESLYKALHADALPRFSTVRKVMSALGVELTFVARASAPTKKRRGVNPAKPAVGGKSATSKGARTRASVTRG